MKRKKSPKRRWKSGPKIDVTKSRYLLRLRSRGLSFAQIAIMMNVSPVTAYLRFKRIKERYPELLAGYPQIKP